ncbi:ParB/RepB/Spo0J family partition protein [Aeromonas sp. R7-5]|uniref:ParB/RepB/Spo0J family partition protein n=1 Tax=Aeromonas sp. R7-5 TaxID=3138477 RepID=UPI0034A38104
MALGNLKGLSELANVAKGKTGKQVLSVPVTDVVSKAQVRKRFRNIEELAATIVTEGQQSPIIVSPKGDDGKYVIQKGERRWRACKHAAIPNIDIIVNDKDQDELDETAGELIENIQRDDLTPLEIAEALDKFAQAGWKKKDIALRLGVNNSFVSSHLSLLKMPDCVRELYDGDISSDTETLNNLRQLFELNADRCRAICAVAMTDGVTRKQSRELLNDAKRIQEKLDSVQLPGLVGDNDGAGGKGNSDLPPPEQENVTSEQDNKHQAGSGSGNSDLDLIEEVSGTGTGNSAPAEPEKHKKPNKTNTDKEGGDALPPMEKDREWKAVRADNLIFVVHVLVGEEVKKGVIMTDRVALNPSTIWVKTLDFNGKEITINVPASSIEILSIEG